MKSTKCADWLQNCSTVYLRLTYGARTFTAKVFWMIDFFRQNLRSGVVKKAAS